MKLTEHFTLQEFERSATAEKYHINNSVPSQYVPVLQQLCKEVLEPLRSFVGKPIIISSGYRCNQLNVKVGGAYASQHTLGEPSSAELRKSRFIRRRGEALAWAVNISSIILSTTILYLLQTCRYLIKSHLSAPHPININRRHAPIVHRTTPCLVLHKLPQSVNHRNHKASISSGPIGS